MQLPLPRRKIRFSKAQVMACPKTFCPQIVPKFSPFWRPQVGIESVSEMANILPLLCSKISPFQIPFYPRFQYPFSPVSDTPFIPVSVTLFIPISKFQYPFIPVSVPALSRAISTPAPVAAIHTCTMPCSQRHKTTHQ